MSSRFAAGSGARLVGVRRRPPPRCWRRSAALPSAALLGCFVRAGARAADGAAAATSSMSPFASEEAVVGFFFPRPPRLPRRRLFFGPVGESSAAGTAAWVSGGASTSATAGSSAAGSSCFLLRNQRNAKGSFSSFGRARAPSRHRRTRPRAAWIQYFGRHDLATGYQPRPSPPVRPRSGSGRTKP